MSTTHNTPQTDAKAHTQTQGRVDCRRREHAARTGDENVSQMHFARKGLITEEMLYVAEREKVKPELIRDEVAAGRMIIPGQY